MDRKQRSRIVGTGLAAVALIAVPAVALGATAASDGERVAYIGDRFADHVIVSSVGNDVRFEAIGDPIQLDGSCTADGAGAVICKGTGAHSYGPRSEVRLRGGDDRIEGGTEASASPAGFESFFDDYDWSTGRGDDFIRITRGTGLANAGPSDDRLIADTGRGATLIGGTGEDTIVFRDSCSTVGAFAIGGSGDDRFVAIRDGGKSGCGNAYGGGGEDTYELRATGRRGLCFATNRCRRNGIGIDRVVGSERGDRIRAVPARFRAATASTIVGRSGRDVLLGARGAFADRINARDGERDRLIDCGGGGRDVALIDRKDPEPKRCERVVIG